ncbi:Flp pilus assembly complex ATPase component TadA [Zavarzinia compransoris]|uniref:GspE/PulE family protein n=1 Tax=Zavarzinia marina TaxID=2911065 RepID=UPI001F3B2A39|nr:ATPase, T2SS/T4P/T4SS family [Zavarzinia marina]MCF4164791.1 Flp pilus assembly complex ATPase component TadA [Zavarzinia marina]
MAALLLDRAVLAPETLARARLVQAETGEALDRVLTRLGMVSERALAEACAGALALPIAAAADFPGEVVAPGRLSPRFLRRARAVPLRETAEAVDVALVDPFDGFAARAIAFALGRPVRAFVAEGRDVEEALDRLYAGHAGPADEGTAAADDADLERMRDLSSDAPVVRLVNGLITRAVDLQASDIHLEPAEDGLKVRFRIDGALIDQEVLAPALRAAVVSRIKVMAGLDIAERRLPQDGRLRFAVRGHDIDFRVATAPVIHGEAVVLRVLDRSHLALDFAALGFSPDLTAAWRRALHRPHGIVLVTGPTGSGKTTTLYASLTELNTAERKILTVEDPIEYRLDGISQTQVRPRIGLDFASALRSFLRQDPDVMMVGEIRDLETVQVAIQASLTGHTILSTLHTNDAASAVTRLLDMGAEPYLVTSTLSAVLAQRLVRRLCPACREAYVPTAEALAALGLPPREDLRFHRAVGCSACGGSGYRGRVAVTELLVMSDALARLVLARAEARDIARTATAEGLRPMLQDGIDKVAAGLTTVDEVLRVTRDG